MKKEILLVWFGDNEPAYAQWNVENFKKMNPEWEVTYVKYTKDQIYDVVKYDKTMQDAVQMYEQMYDEHNVTSSTDKGLSRLAKYYKRCYTVNAHNPVVYCDLDCFPIAPFDDFFILGSFSAGNFRVFGEQNWKHDRPKRIGPSAHIYRDNVQFHIGNDDWCLSNMLKTRCQFMQICTSTDLTKPLTCYNGCVFNAYQDCKQMFDCRKQQFENCSIEFGDNACCTSFSPVEHYYIRERRKSCYDNTHFNFGVQASTNIINSI